MTVIRKSIRIDWVNNEKLIDCLDTVEYLKGSLKSYKKLKIRWRSY